MIGPAGKKIEKYFVSVVLDQCSPAACGYRVPEMWLHLHRAVLWV